MVFKSTITLYLIFALAIVTTFGFSPSNLVEAKSNNTTMEYSSSRQNTIATRFGFHDLLSIYFENELGDPSLLEEETNGYEDANYDDSNQGFMPINQNEPESISQELNLVLAEEADYKNRINA